MIILIYHLGIFHQYDGMIFPERPSPGIAKRLLSAIGFGSEKKLPNRESVQEQSLLLFLENHKNALISYQLTLMDKLNFTNCVNDIYHIFSQLQRQNICHGNYLSDTFCSAHLTEVITFNL